MTSSAKNSEWKALSANCFIISSVGSVVPIAKNCIIWFRNVARVASPFTNKCFLSKDEVEKQVQKERQARLNAEIREKYWREKFEAECLEMDDEDHTDLSAMFDKAGSNVNEHMATLGNNCQNSCDAIVKRRIAGI